MEDVGTDGRMTTDSEGRKFQDTILVSSALLMAHHSRVVNPNTFMFVHVYTVRYYIIITTSVQRPITTGLHLHPLGQSHPPIMLHHNRASHRRLVRHPLPNWIDVRSFEITSAVPVPTPYYQAYSLDGEQEKMEEGGEGGEGTNRVLRRA
jgi:hypothetical protein